MRAFAEIDQYQTDVSKVRYIFHNIKITLSNSLALVPKNIKML